MITYFAKSQQRFGKINSLVFQVFWEVQGGVCCSDSHEQESLHFC